jgi:hypothetical protein
VPAYGKTKRRRTVRRQDYLTGAQAQATLGAGEMVATNPLTPDHHQLRDSRDNHDHHHRYSGVQPPDIDV